MSRSNNPKSTESLKALVECALLLALGTVLAQVKLFRMPSGGSVTLLSMLPFIIVSFRHGVKWGLLTGFANSLMQMLLGGLYAPPAGTFIALMGSVLLDYVIAYMVLGLACVFARPFGDNSIRGVAAGTAAVCLLRFLCAFLSGFLIWGSLLEDGWGAVTYSLGYNASYLIPESILTVIGCVLLFKKAPSLFKEK